MKIGCVLLAAGNAERFGSNKLLTVFHGKTLIENTLESIPAELFAHIVVVTAYDRVEQLSKEAGFEVIRNAHPEYGIRHTISLGLSAMMDMDACMFCVCDQPYISKESIRRMLAEYSGGIAALSFESRRGNPVIFPKKFFGELEALGAGESGTAVIARHQDELSLYPVSNPLELADIDTAEDFTRLNGIKNLFVTGTKEAGKSTLLNYAISLSGILATGFITRPYEICGHPAGHFIHSLSVKTALEENDKPISVRSSDCSCIPIERVFDEFGTKFLQAAQMDHAPLILMDELGVIEQKAPKFQSCVLQCLDQGKPVLGSLKAVDSQWLAEIAQRPDTLVLELNEENRDAVLNRVMNFLLLWWKNE